MYLRFTSLGYSLIADCGPRDNIKLYSDDANNVFAKIDHICSHDMINDDSEIIIADIDIHEDGTVSGSIDMSVELEIFLGE